MLLKNISVAMPMTTSGRTIGKKLIVWMYAFPWNLYQLMPIAASVPSIVATSEEVNAMNKLLNSAVQSGVESKKSFLYQTRENPVNVVSFALLNEKNIMTKSGMKRKSNVRTSTVFERLNCGLRFFHERFACRIGSEAGFAFVVKSRGFFISYLHQLMKLCLPPCQWK